MPSDDREQQFERGLARHLRGGSGDAACPDAEILAAYHERTLAPEELEQWKKHIAGCARCQETLALVEGSELALEEQKEKEVVEHLQQVSTSLRSEPASAPKVWAAPAVDASVVAVKGAGTVKSAAGKKSTMLRWAAPVGAIAAMLILWLGVRHSRNSFEHSPAQNPVQMAENRESRQEVSQNEPKAADEGRAAALATKKTAPPLEDYAAQEKDSAAKPAPPMIRPPAVNGPRRSAGVYAQRDNSLAQDSLDEQIRSEAAQGKLQQPITPSRKTDGAGYGSGAGVAAGAMPATAAPPPPPVVAGDAVGANAMSSQADAYAPSPSPAKPTAAARAKQNKAKEEMPQNVPQAAATPSVDSSSTSQTVTVESKRDLAIDERSDTQLITLAPGVAGGNVITVATGKQGWRVGTGGLIEHTSDAGKTWKAQKSGVTADLISGTAPTEKICWVVGKAGIVLLTTDGGKHWNVLSAPVGEDLARVEAPDAQHAKIWSAGGNAAYVTDDGGLSWAPLGGAK